MLHGRGEVAEHASCEAGEGCLRATGCQVFEATGAELPAKEALNKQKRPEQMPGAFDQ
jgi:hypothetical protein